MGRLECDDYFTRLALWASDGSKVFKSKRGAISDHSEKRGAISDYSEPECTAVFGNGIHPDRLAVGLPILETEHNEAVA